VFGEVSLINQETGFSLAGFGGGFFNMGDDITYFQHPFFVTPDEFILQ
jgi:hypothetical protein